MKKLWFVIAIISLIASCSYTVFAVITTIDSVDAPASVRQHCILVPKWWYIDSCPAYRQDLRELNQSLANQRSALLSSGVSVLRDGLESQRNTLIKERIILSKQWDAKAIFLHDYTSYLVALLFRDLLELRDHRQAVRDFFQKTYDTQDQSWLSLYSLSWYKASPRQYDTQLFLQIGVRNFSDTAISSIEDIYCFTTINEQDYIYPLGVRQTIDANTIVNLVVPLDVGTTPLTDLEKERKLFCTMVYTRDGQEVYSNWQSLKFTVNS